MQWVLLVFGALACVVGAGLLAGAWGESQRRRAIARIPTTPTGGAGPGPVEVQGRAAPAEAPVAARLTEGEGVMGVWRVQEMRRSGKSSQWVTLHEEREAPPFHVDDGTGPILVDAAEADVDAEPTFLAESGMGRDPPPRVLAYLQSRDVTHEGWLGVNRRMRFTETLVKAGEPLYVLGVAEAAPPGAKARYVIRSGTRQAPFILSTRGEKGAKRRALQKALGLALGGLLFLAVGALMMLDATGNL